MKSFRHHNARTLKQASSLLSRYGGKAVVNAGGTDLLGTLRDKSAKEYPEALINIKTIPKLDYIRAGKGGLRIGALARLADIVKSPAIKKDYSLLAEAAHSVASPNVRNVATLGGNLAQDVRCWYYRYPQQIGGPITCLRKGGKTCSALVGDNRYHSIFGAAAASERRCASHCPAHIDVPDCARMIRENDFPAAAGLLLRKNPFPAITGRICPIFCEPNCNRSEYDEPVAIHSIERGVGDHILNHAADYFHPPDFESGKKISIVGSGPAGLAAAYYLRQEGHQVTVYEKLPEPGGMLFYTVPPYRLPKDVVRKQIQALKDMGIRFETNADVDEGMASTITANSDAVLVARGTWRSVLLNVPGENSRGVYGALEYLKKTNAAEKIALGARVVVIGGGSVAMDAARTARRTGSGEVHVVCLESRDLSSKDRMPALDWEILEAEEEGITIHPSLGIRQIRTLEGKAAGVETRRCASVRDADGRFNPQYDDTSSSPDFTVDSIIVAIGQTVDEVLFAPSAKVFTGGDMVEGASTVIRAVASARKAVDEIRNFLGTAKQPDEPGELQQEFPASRYEDIPRSKAAKIPAGERLQSILVEDAAGLSESEVRREASRCVSCGCLAVGPSDLATALVALEAKVVTTKRTLPAQAFFTATATNSTVLETDELIREVQIPKPPKGTRQSYMKFTVRKPVDFAIVSVASIVTEKRGICSSARIAVGAVAPAPFRAIAAERGIQGKAINEQIAGEAADQVMAAAQPLGMNAYKVQIAKTLIRRSLLGATE